MWRFLFLTVILMVVGGTILHTGVDIPYISFWLGMLPGDFLVERKEIVYYFPIVSAMLVSFIICLVLWIISKFKKQ